MLTLLLNKPFGVLSQFTRETGSRWGSLADLVNVPNVYAAGRLDADSEGLLILTENGRLQQRITDPRFGHWRTYWVQVEGLIEESQLTALEQGLVIQGQRSRPARAARLDANLWCDLPERTPPIRVRRSIPTSWMSISLREGRNRQVRRMTAAVGLPTLRLIRRSIDLMDGAPPLSLEGLEPGKWRPVSRTEQQRLKALLKNQGARR